MESSIKIGGGCMKKYVLLFCVIGMYATDIGASEKSPRTRNQENRKCDKSPGIVRDKSWEELVKQRIEYLRKQTAINQTQKAQAYE